MCKKYSFPFSLLSRIFPYNSPHLRSPYFPVLSRVSMATQPTVKPSSYPSSPPLHSSNTPAPPTNPVPYQTHPPPVSHPFHLQNHSHPMYPPQHLQNHPQYPSHRPPQFPSHSAPQLQSHTNGQTSFSSSMYQRNNPLAHPHSQQSTQPPRNPRVLKSYFSFCRPQNEPHVLPVRKHGKEKLEDMSAVFSLLTATERLENMWARRGAISQEDYENQCEKLIQQYNVLHRSTQASIPNLDLFISEYGCKASMARHRLKAGVPATVTASSSAANKPKDLGKFVVRCTANFHELGNAIDLQQYSVSMLLPSIISLCRSLDSIVRVAAHGRSFDFVKKLTNWRDKLDAMPAHASLSEEDASRLKLDLNTSYEEFESVFND